MQAEHKDKDKEVMQKDACPVEDIDKEKDGAAKGSDSEAVQQAPMQVD